MSGQNPGDISRNLLKLEKNLNCTQILPKAWEELANYSSGLCDAIPTGLRASKVANAGGVCTSQCITS